MTSIRRARPQRYQLGKRALAVLAGTHPWIFRGLVSSAADALADGQWLALYDGANQVVGHGVYAAEGAIAIRILARGPTRPRGEDFLARIDRAVAKRAKLRVGTDGFRAIHGESDELPGVVVDVFGTAVVAQSYGAGLDALARLAAMRVARSVGATGVVLRDGHRRVGGVAARILSGGPVARPSPVGSSPAGSPSRDARLPAPPRVIAGTVPDLAWFREGSLRLAARPVSGQKSGTFLDLRGLRKWVAAQPLAGTRVLNLFAYTGAIGLAAEHAGATAITQIDRAADALEFAAAHHVVDATRHRFITADVFDWCKDGAGRFELVIVDPPSMTSRIDQVPGVLATYRRLHAAAAARVAPGGTLVVACCTSRISRTQFRDQARINLRERFALVHELKPEVDHPVSFPEADYLKVLVFRERENHGA